MSMRKNKTANSWKWNDAEEADDDDYHEETGDEDEADDDDEEKKNTLYYYHGYFCLLEFWKTNKLHRLWLSTLFGWGKN